METRTIDLGGPVHFLEGGSGPPLVLVHGLGGSHVNWLAVAPRLAEKRRVLAIDLLGFGRTAPLGRSSKLEENRALLGRFLKEFVREPAGLVGNSMGGLISILQAAADPETVRELVLVDPAQPRPSNAPLDPTVAARLALDALPFVGEWAMAQRSARLGAEGVVRAIFELCCVDVSRIPAPVFAAHVAIARERLEHMPWANAAFLEALRSIMAVILRPGKFKEIVAKIKAPALILHGTKDRLVPIEASRALVQLRPDWKLVELEDTGHVPQLERPEQFVEIVLPWLEGADRP
jgi:pimeloyl-ACP methyl ester carboxylesterase